jgi:hypothetical protein
MFYIRPTVRHKIPVTDMALKASFITYELNPTVEMAASLISFCYPYIYHCFYSETNLLDLNLLFQLFA